MRRGLAGPTLMKILGILVIFMAIYIVIDVIVPFVMYGVFSSCWGKLVGEVNLLAPHPWEMGNYKNVTIEYGTCASGLLFINHDILETTLARVSELENEIKKQYGRDIDLRSKIVCSETAKSHIIGVPRFEKETEVGGFFTWMLMGAGAGGLMRGKWGAAAGALSATTIRDRLKENLDDVEKSGKVPFCIDLDKEFEESISVPDFGEPLDEYYCILFHKGGDVYRAEGKKGKCEENSAWVKETENEMKEKAGEETLAADRAEAKKYLDEKRYASAVSAYEKLLKPESDYPGKDEDMANLALCYFYTKLYDKCIDTSIQLSEKYPSSQYMPNALFARGSSYQAIEKVGLAIVSYQEIIDKYPESTFAASAKPKIKEICESEGPPVRCQDLEKSKYYPEEP